MATTVDTLLVRIESDMSDIRRDLKRLETQTGQTTSKVRRSLSGMGTAFKAILGGVLVAQLARGTMALTKFASDMEEMSAMSEAVFGGFIHSVRDELGQFGEAVGRSSFDLEKMAASVQDTFVPLGFARGQAADLSVALTKLAVDVASFKNESEQATMQAFQSALVGNHEAVRRFGIVITEAELKAELFRMGITKNAKDVDAATKVQARLNLIMAGTVDAQGDAAKTSGSYANQTRALDAQLKLLAADVGSELLPVMKDLVAISIEATKGFRNFLHALGVGGSASLKAAKATQARMVAELELERVMERVTKNNRLSAQKVNSLIIPAQMKLAEAALAEDKAITHLMESKGLLNAETDKQAASQKKANTEISDAQKFITEQANKQEILMLKLRNSSEATILQKEAQHDLGKEYLENKDLIDKTIQVTADMTARLDAQTEATKKLKEIEDERQERQDAGVATLKDLEKQHALLTAQINDQTEAEIKQLEAALEMGNLEGGLSAEILRQIALNEEAAAKLAEKTAATDAYNEKVKEGQGIVEGFASEESKLREQLEAVNLAMQSAAVEDMPLYQSAIDGLNQKIKETNPQFKAMKEAAEKAADAVSDSLADAFVEGELSMDSFKDIFKNFIKDLIKQAIKAAIIKHILGPIFGGGFGGGGSLPAGDTTFAAFAGGGKIPSRAGGGPVLVGERGPELFIPHSSGVIRNNHDTMNMMGGTAQPVVNQTINVSTGVANTVRAEIMTLMPVIKAETIGAMVDGKKRGNAISKVFS